MSMAVHKSVSCCTQNALVISVKFKNTHFNRHVFETINYDCCFTNKNVQFGHLISGNFWVNKRHAERLSLRISPPLEKTLKKMLKIVIKDAALLFLMMRFCFDELIIFWRITILLVVHTGCLTQLINFETVDSSGRNERKHI